MDNYQLSEVSPVHIHYHNHNHYQVVNVSPKKEGQINKIQSSRYTNRASSARSKVDTSRKRSTDKLCKDPPKRISAKRSSVHESILTNSPIMNQKVKNQDN